MFAALGRLTVTAGGRCVVCHACGEPLASISAQHLARHGLTQASYRARFGLNRKQSLVAPQLAQARRVEGRRRWASNEALREGLAVGQEMARDGRLNELGVAAQPAGSRSAQGRFSASQGGASPALRADRERRSVEARARWAASAAGLGFASLAAYIADRRAAGASTHRVRTELGCGGSAAQRLLAGDWRDLEGTSP